MKLDATDQKVCCMTLLAISNKYNLCVNLMQERAAAALLFSLKFWSLRLSKSSRGFFDQSLEIELPTLVFGTYSSLLL